MKPIETLAIRVLLIEDEPFLRATFKRILLMLGCTEVQEAADGSAAIKILDGDFRPDLVICDVQMAPMDGVTFLRLLRLMPDRALATVPVIMLTAMDDKLTVQASADLAVSGYLLKPVFREQLAEQINAIFRRSAAPRTARDAVENLVEVAARP